MSNINISNLSFRYPDSSDNIFNNLEDLIEKINNLRNKNYSEKNRIKAQSYKDINMLKGYLNIL